MTLYNPFLAQILDGNAFLFQLSGKLYSLFRLTGSSAWESGVAVYEVLESGDLRVQVTGSVHGKCQGTSTAVLAHTDVPYKFTLSLGKHKGEKGR